MDQGEEFMRNQPQNPNSNNDAKIDAKIDAKNDAKRGAETTTYSRQRDWRALSALISLIVLVIFFTLVTENFLSLGILRLVLQQGAILAIVATGLTFVMLCGEIDLSVGEMAIWTCCLCGVLFDLAGGAPKASTLMVLGILVACFASSAGLGLISGMLTVASRLPTFIITLAMMNIARGLAQFLTRSASKDVPKFLKDLGTGKWSVPLGENTLDIPYTAVLAGFVLLLAHVLLQHTRFGRYIYMTGGNREAARLAGVRTGTIIVSCMALCAVLAGLGGLVNAGRLQSASILNDPDLLLKAVACVVLGGTSLSGGEGGMGQTLLGVLTFTILQVGLNQIRGIDEMLRGFLTGMVLMVALVIQGFLAQDATTRQQTLRMLLPWFR